MKSLREEFYDTIYIHEMPAEHLNKALEELLQAVKKRDVYCVGEDDDIDHDENASPAKILEDAKYEGLRNFLRSEIRQRMEETL